LNPIKSKDILFSCDRLQHSSAGIDSLYLQIGGANVDLATAEMAPASARIQRHFLHPPLIRFLLFPLL
jgi:hypothetical protein